nr:uncharacterized protein LOC113794380 [Dermatophagoides pteronyssinus]
MLDPSDSCQPNFGYCNCLKLYIIITLFLAMCVYFTDSCVYLLMIPESLNTTFITNNNLTKTTTTTFYNNNGLKSNIESSESSTLSKSLQDELSEMEFCEFKFAYIIALILGLIVYGLIFAIYTCQLIIYFYNFPWYLFESIILGSYSSVLFLMTIVAFITNGHPIGTSLVLSDCLLGLILAFVLFRNHTEGIVPAALIVQYDPDGNLLTQILSRRHFL